MSKRLLVLAAVLTILSACAETSEVGVDFGDGVRFVPSVADSVDDVGMGASAALGPDGVPYVSYLGFPSPVAEGEIAPNRPIGSPYVPGVLLASVSDGIWTRGAVEHNKPPVEPPGVTIPFGPQVTENLALSAEGAAGTAVTVGADGSVHVVWTANNGVFYAKASSTTSASVEQLYGSDLAIETAGPVSRPAIALDGDGNPWVSYAINLDGLVEVMVATPGVDGWDQEIAAETSCEDCALPPTGIGLAGGVPVVLFADPAAGELTAAAPGKKGWDTQMVDEGAEGLGLATTSAGDKAYASYYTGSGSVRVATFDGASWAAAEVAKAKDPSADSGTAAENTAIAVDANATVWVAWDDAGIKLASGDGSTFQEVGTQGTSNGAHPAVAAGAGGVVYLAWYDTFGKNLMVGALGDIADVVIANPSPSSAISLAPSGGSECGADGKTVLDLIAKSSLFDPTCLVAEAGKDFEINLDNQDAGIPHNINIFTEKGGDSLAATTLENGPVKQTLKVSAMGEGSYYFQCDAHPTTMVGTLAIVAAKNK